MPIIKSAQKKLRQDRSRTQENQKVREQYKASLRSVRRAVSNKSTISNKEEQAAYSSIDKASKKGVIHPNKAARLKSRVSKLIHKAQ